MKPGLIEPQCGEHEVVWWDPSKLELNVDGGYGIRQKEILAEDGGASLAAYHEWQLRRAEAIDAGARPQFDIFIASEAADAPPVAAEVRTEFVSRAESRPGGRRFGTLVHAILRDASLHANGPEIERLAALHARAIGATAEERAAAAMAVEAALEHPVIERARKSARLHREYPVTLTLDGGRLLDGMIDLAFLEKDEWMVVDFKTDADVSERRTHYERQLQWYAFALSKLTGFKARSVLFSV